MNKIVELINQATIEVDSNKKVEYLYQVKELLNNSIDNNNQVIIDKFFHDILAFQNDRAPNVKKFVLTFIETACKNSYQLCPKAVLSLNLLLNDTNTEVIKRSIQAATQFYRALTQWIVNANNAKIKSCNLTTTTSGSSPLSPKQQQLQSQHQQQTSQIKTDHNIKTEIPTDDLNKGETGSLESNELTSDIEKTWLMWLQIKNFICNLLETTNNDGIRTHCIKFIETIVLMQTPRDKYTDPGHELNLIDPILPNVKLSTEAIMCGVNGLPKNGILFNEENKLELVESAKKNFEQLVSFHGTSHISSVNLMAAMQSLVVLAKQRYRLFMGRVIQTMESLNNRLPPTLTESQVQSVRKFLKLQLTVMLKHPYSLDRFQHQITQLLQTVGTKQLEIHKVIQDFKTKFGCDSPILNTNNSNDVQKRIKLEPGLIKQQPGSQGFGSQGTIPTAKAKHLDLNKLTQELDEKEKRKIVVDSLRRILGDEGKVFISPAQMEIKKKVLSTLANEFNNTECPQIIQDYIFDDLKNRHEICYSIIRKNYDIAAAKAAKRQINLFDHQELLKNYFDCFNSYLNRAMDLKDSQDKEIILPKLYELRDEYYTISNQDQEQDDK